MPCFHRFLAWFHRVARMYLVDRCLLLLFTILLIQVTVNLFVNEVHSGEIHTIDTVIRTSTAAIFGYFISGNFQERQRRGPSASVSEIAAPPKPHRYHNGTQVIIVTFIGIFALVVLLVCRNFDALSSAAAASISQMRDFVSGCVGYLISCSTGEKD